VNRSLRGTLILGTSIGVAVVFSAAGALLYFLLRDSLVAQIDHALSEKARLVASNVELQGSTIKFELDWLNDGHPQLTAVRDELQIWSGDGKVVYRSPRLQGADLLRFGGSPTSPNFRWSSLPGGINGRAIGISFQPGDGEENLGDYESDANSQHESSDKSPAATNNPIGYDQMTLVLIRDATPLETTLARMRLILFLVGCAAVATSLIALTVVIGWSLRPLHKLTTEIGLLDAADLAARVDQHQLPNELVPLVDRLNDLLGRLEAAFVRERAFSADVAHELRTPLAGLRSTIEVTLSRSRQSSEYRDTLAECQQIAVQLHCLVENLLALARLESGDCALSLNDVSINHLVQDQWAEFAQAADDRKLQVRWQLGSEQKVRVDAARFRLALRNILSNSAAYTDFAGSVRISTARIDDYVVISVANTGSSIPSENADDVFKRFWRGDKARSDVGVHFGLGLSLTKKIVTAMNGKISVKTQDAGEFEITILIPAGEALIKQRQETAADQHRHAAPEQFSIS
jgi:two-component system, OmpR family, heavy metal sensor histidine kinase CusS